jgi:hypothetical protein
MHRAGFVAVSGAKAPLIQSGGDRRLHKATGRQGAQPPLANGGPREATAPQNHALAEARFASGQSCQPATQQDHDVAGPRRRRTATPQDRAAAGPRRRKTAPPQYCDAPGPRRRKTATPQDRNGARPQRRGATASQEMKNRDAARPRPAEPGSRWGAGLADPPDITGLRPPPLHVPRRLQSPPSGGRSIRPDIRISSPARVLRWQVGPGLGDPTDPGS